MKLGITTDMKSETEKTSRQMMPAPSELRFHSELVVPLREPITASLPLSFQTWQELARANPAAGSTVNEYKTSLQLPGTHLGLRHPSRSHSSIVYQALLDVS